MRQAPTVPGTTTRQTQEGTQYAVRVRIAQALLAELTAHAVAEAPRECCGLLIGTAGEVVETARTTNLEAGVTRFLVDPAEHFAVIKRLRGSPLGVIGAYHSHPRSAPEPSPSDLAEAASDDFLCVIVSLLAAAEPMIRAYHLRGGAACPVEIVS